MVLKARGHTKRIPNMLRYPVTKRYNYSLLLSLKGRGGTEGGVLSQTSCISLTFTYSISTVFSVKFNTADRVSCFIVNIIIHRHIKIQTQISDQCLVILEVYFPL